MSINVENTLTVGWVWDELEVELALSTEMGILGLPGYGWLHCVLDCPDTHSWKLEAGNPDIQFF